MHYDPATLGQRGDCKLSVSLKGGKIMDDTYTCLKVALTCTTSAVKDGRKFKIRIKEKSAPNLITPTGIIQPGKTRTSLGVLGIRPYRYLSAAQENNVCKDCKKTVVKS